MSDSPRPFKDLADDVKAHWSDAARTVYAAALTAFADSE